MNQYWLNRSLRKGMEYRDSMLHLHITPCDDNGFSIILKPSQEVSNRNVILHIGFRGDEIIVQDLVGNGDNSGLQNKGYGTLLFNLAIQVLRVIYVEEPDAPIKGKVSNRGDSEDIEGCAKRRNHFWSRFGFQLADATKPNSTMKASLNELKIVNQKQSINHQLPVLSLDQFYRYFNRSLISSQDIKSIREFHIDQLSQDVELKADDLLLLNKARLLANWLAVTLSLLFLGGILIASIHAGFEMDTIFAVLSGAGFALFVFYIFRFHHLLSLSPSYHRYNKIYSNKVEASRKNISILEQHEQNNKGAFKRACAALAPLYPELQSEDMKNASLCAISCHFGETNIKTHMEFIELLQGILNQNYILGSDPQTQLNDFLFGKIQDGKICSNNLQPLIQKLSNNAFIYHVNRLLKQCDQNRLIITDGSSHPTGFSDFVERIANDVALVELYRSAEPTSEMPLLYLRFYLSEGCVDFRADLIVWKMIRAEELVACLKALRINNLIDKTYINVDKEGQGYYSKHFVPTSPKETLKEVIDYLSTFWMDDKDINYLLKCYGENHTVA